MYYPYFRGRQNELLSLRELLEQGKLPDTVMPVIEPVRFNSTLFTTLSTFVDMERDVIVISNPEVGKFKKEYNEMKKSIEEEENEEQKEKLQSKLDEYLDVLRSSHVIGAYIGAEKIFEKCLSGGVDMENIVLINTSNENFDYYEEHGIALEAKLTFIPKDEDFKDEVYGKVVMLEDKYNKAERNSDYLDCTDESFSRDHIIYTKRGYHGFSDYSIVGNQYEESGFAPKAIAIHIMYFGKKNELRIHHFVSDSNESILDPARKFEEAMYNMLQWENYEIIPQTYGLNCLIKYYEQGRFPGLGMIKKCSIMHHLEMLGDYLEDNR